jgi:hypothetical protein
MGAGSSCSDYVAPVAFPVPVYRFWLPKQETHFFSISEREKDSLQAESEKDCVFEGVAYFAFLDGAHPDCLPVYRFWSDTIDAYFYTISEKEKVKLETQYSRDWTYECVAFYAFPEGRQPVDAVPVHRFWSGTAGYHFYTISEAEKDDLMKNHAGVWVYEGVAWYAHQP